MALVCKVYLFNVQATSLQDLFYLRSSSARQLNNITIVRTNTNENTNVWKEKL